MGSVEFEKYIEYYILQQASVYVQNRKKHLLTFSDKRIGRSRVSQLERDRKLVQTFLHIRLKWLKQTENTLDRLNEQYISIPLAIATNDGTPRVVGKLYLCNALLEKLRH